MAKIKTMGFGFNPTETKHHFYAITPRKNNENFVIYERFSWDSTENQLSDMDDSKMKVSIPKEKWNIIKPIIEKEFNKKLIVNNMVNGKFKLGGVPLNRLFGKELVLLLWAIEDCDNDLITVAIRNWLGLSPEERWWLFTMANASTGHYKNKRGWRIAIKYALADNPIANTVNGHVLEYLYSKA